eukprot:286289-Rhodomonas_salina.1
MQLRSSVRECRERDTLRRYSCDRGPWRQNHRLDVRCASRARQDIQSSDQDKTADMAFQAQTRHKTSPATTRQNSGHQSTEPDKRHTDIASRTMIAVVPFMTISLGGVCSRSLSSDNTLSSSNCPTSNGSEFNGFPISESAVRFVRNPVSGGRTCSWLSSKLSVLREVRPPMAAGSASIWLSPSRSSRSCPSAPI